MATAFAAPEVTLRPGLAEVNLAVATPQARGALKPPLRETASSVPALIFVTVLVLRGLRRSAVRASKARARTTRNERSLRIEEDQGKQSLQSDLSSAARSKLWTEQWVSSLQLPIAQVKGEDPDKASESSGFFSKTFQMQAWAVLVGASVTARLACSVRLLQSSGFDDPFLASVSVSARSLLLSACCLLPFTSWSTLPRDPRPWIAGACALPGFSLITAASVLGLGMSQMSLKLSTLLTALTLDWAMGKIGAELPFRLAGTSLVLLGCGAGLFLGGAGAANPVSCFSPVGMACLVGTLTSGAGFVLQSRFSSSKEPRTLQAEAGSAMLCNISSAAFYWILLLVMGHLTFPMRGSDAGLWIFEGLQGAVYLRSLQSLTRHLGFSSTFTLTLCGQLVSAAALDALQQGVPSMPRLAGLCLVLAGTIFSNRPRTAVA